MLPSPSIHTSQALRTRECPSEPRSLHRRGHSRWPSAEGTSSPRCSRGWPKGIATSRNRMRR